MEQPGIKILTTMPDDGQPDRLAQFTDRIAIKNMGKWREIILPPDYSPREADSYDGARTYRYTLDSERGLLLETIEMPYQFVMMHGLYLVQVKKAPSFR